MKKHNLFKIFVFICLFLMAVSVLIPVIWVLFASLKDDAEFYGNAWSLPQGLAWENFSRAWKDANMGSYFANSLIVTGLGLALLLIVAVPASYVLSRFEFRGRKGLNSYLKAGLFVNLSYIVIPIFLMILGWDRALQKNAGLDGAFFLNNPFILAVIYAATAIPFTVYLLSNYFRTISKTYEEAAYIDGAGYFRTMCDIMIPMAKPSVITVILFNFLSFWNEYILAQTLMTKNYTLPVGLINLQQASRGAAEYGKLYAGLVIVMLPTLILYILVQKQLTEGMMVGGDKG